MNRVEKTIEIKVPPEKGWKMLTMDRFPEWIDGLKSVEYISNTCTSKDKYKVGTSVHIIEKHEEGPNLSAARQEGM